MARSKDDRTSDTILKIGVRDILDAVYREGGLRGIQYNQLSRNAGTRTHQAFFHMLEDQYRQFLVETEVSFTYTWQVPEDENLLIDGIQLRGRADVRLTPIDDERVVSFYTFEEIPSHPFFIEVKTLLAPLDAMPEQGETLHWLQVRFYTYMYFRALEDKGELIPETLTYALAYVSQETLESKLLTRHEAYADLCTWADTTFHAYFQMASSRKAWEIRRDNSIRSMGFPYPNPRSGQLDFIKKTYDAISRTTPLLAQAPTGIGKTMSVLYPAIKQILNKNYEHIFYLTAKTSTRRVAESAIDDLREVSNLHLRQITLQAKESMCLAPSLYCDTEICPYARTYYDNLQEGINELLPVEKLTPNLIMKAGEKYKLCPFELSLDMSVHCDLIIGDYNHAFDPRIRLDRYFSEKQGHQILLIDEAHNLVDRSREMYSVTLDEGEFRALLEKMPTHVPFLLNLWESILEYFHTLNQGIAQGASTWETLETSEDSSTMRVLSQENFRATTSRLRELSKRLMPWLQQSREMLDMIEDPKDRRKLIELIGKTKFFHRITEEFWSKSYIACARRNQDQVSVRLICLDVSERLSQTYMNTHASVFFSATLSPMSYFAINFCGKDMDNRPDTLVLPSPFPAENLDVFLATFIPTVYNKRKDSAAALAKALALTILIKKGQQFIFFPSFAYMDLILPYLKKILTNQNIVWLEQKRRMSNQAREAYLEAFSSPEENKTLVAVAVLGGIFGEGIDLVGDKLTGVSIVGVGLPQISPERNIMREYYDEEYQGGFLFAYQYPGMNKVLQAAGRLIRSEEDRGFLLLIDERYGHNGYRSLLPEEWIIQEVDSLAELKSNLEESQIL